jgi:hypothetical protein
MFSAPVFLKSIYFHVICFAYYLDIVRELIRQNDAALFLEINIPLEEVLNINRLSDRLYKDSLLCPGTILPNSQCVRAMSLRIVRHTTNI